MSFADARDSGPSRAQVLEFSDRVFITLAGTVARGDLLGYSPGWKRAIATTGGVVQGRLVAGEDGISGQVITAYRSAVISNRYSGATGGNPVYAARGSGNDGLEWVLHGYDSNFFITGSRRACNARPSPGRCVSKRVRSDTRRRSSRQGRRDLRRGSDGVRGHLSR